MQERDKIYREAIDAAKAANDADLVKVFDQTRDTEVEHANLMNAAVRQLDKYREQKHFFVCDTCGYTSDIDLPMCALCRVGRHPHGSHVFDVWRSPDDARFETFSDTDLFQASDGTNLHDISTVIMDEWLDDGPERYFA